MIRPSEDTAEQRAALADARDALALALEDLSGIAHREAKAAGSKRGRPDVDAVYAAVNAVRRAETDLDTATYDLATASGADG